MADDQAVQRTGSAVASFVFMSILSPLFWSSKVRDTTWAWKVPGSFKSIRLCCNNQNYMFRSLISCALLPSFVAYTYPQGIIEKKNLMMTRFSVEICMPVISL